MTGGDRPSTPDIRVPPPLLFLAAFVAGWLLHRYVQPVVYARGSEGEQRARLSGEVLITLGAVLVLWAIIVFKRAHTSVLPFRPASRLVTHGPYRFSRNPMYVGMAIVYVGTSLAMNVVWPLFFLPAVFLALYRLVVSREERYLDVSFGESYAQYRRRGRRWL